MRKRDVQVRPLRPNDAKVVGLKAGMTEGTAMAETGIALHVGSRRGGWENGTSRYKPRGWDKESPGMLPRISVFSRFLHFALRF